MDRDTHTQNACLHQRAHLCALAEGCVSGQRRPSLLPIAQWLILAADRQGWGGITCPLPLAQHRKGKWNTAHAQKLPEGLCVSMGRGGEQVSCFLYCEIWSKNQAPLIRNSESWNEDKVLLMVTDVSGLGTQNVSFPSQAWEFLNHTWSEVLNWTRFLSAIGWTHR